MAYVNPNAKPGDAITRRERQVLWLLIEGWPNKNIADKLDISQHTAKYHIANVVTKLNARSRTHAAVLFVLSDSMAAYRDGLKISKRRQHA